MVVVVIMIIASMLVFVIIDRWMAPLSPVV